MMKKTRPLGVTILAILAILGALHALIYTLQMLHLLPMFYGPVMFFTFSLIGAFFWGLLFFIWIAVFWSLWEVQQQGWFFMVAISVINLVYAVISWLGASSWQAMAPIILISGVILVYCLLPSTKKAFGVPS